MVWGRKDRGVRGYWEKVGAEAGGGRERGETTKSENRGNTTMGTSCGAKRLVASIVTTNVFASNLDEIFYLGANLAYF